MFNFRILLLLISFGLLTSFDTLKKCEEVRVSHILTIARTENEMVIASEKSLQILAEIKSGKISFEDAAAKYGEDGARSRGGELGWFGKGVMVEPFEKACFKAKVDDLFIVKTTFGSHVVIKTGERKVDCPE